MARVEFIVTPWALRSGRIIKALVEVFGEKTRQYANCEKPLTIECSPERFCQYLIARNEYGADNAFKELKLRFVKPAPKEQKLTFD